MVRERIDNQIRYNQPAGHLESGESLLDAVIRETLEESAWSFHPDFIVGLYRWISPSGITFCRVAFAGTVGNHMPHRSLDRGIEAAEWMTLDEITGLAALHRSPMVLQCIVDYQAGHCYPLALLREAM